MSKKKLPEPPKEGDFAKVMLGLSRSRDLASLFSDFLEMTVCALAVGSMEEQYLRITKKYSAEELKKFAEALAALVIEMDDHGFGLKDVLGEFFMTHITHGHNGQYFTPENICDAMAIISMGDCPEKMPRVLDPACGSGRMLMSSAKVTRNALYYGADNSRICALMSTINFCLNGLFGEVAWMDSLRNTFHEGWKIEMHPIGRIPYVVPIKEDQSYIILRLPKQVG